MSSSQRYEQSGSDRPGGPGVPDGHALAHPLPGVEDDAEGDIAGAGSWVSLLNAHCVTKCSS